jgi:molecular chaperone GrpE
MFRGALTVLRVGSQLPIAARPRAVPVARVAPRFFFSTEPAPTNNSSAEQAQDPAASLKEVVKKLEDDVKGLKDKVLRAYAEEENVRRIAKRDVESAKEYANTKFAKSLLDVADNLDRALDAVTPQQRQSGDAPFKTLVEGLELTRNGLTKVFAEHGITKVQGHTISHVPDTNILLLSIVRSGGR